MKNLPFQLPLRPALPNVYGPLDYRELRAILIRIDHLLRHSGVEYPLIHGLLKARGDRTTEKMVNRHFTGLRCGIARRLLGLAYRDFAVRLADSTLLQWFTQCGDYGLVLPISKSTAERYDKVFTPEALAEITHQINRAAAAEDPAIRLGGLNEALDLGEVLADCTCVKANIHFPVDWVLLRDAVRTLIKAIGLIRREGLKHRMAEPEGFLRRINKLCMEMSGARRTTCARRTRKRILRAMKKLSRTVGDHGLRYRKLLDAEWRQTGWTRKQADQVLARIDRILEQLPAAIHQAHERIIGERRVANPDKILSLYEPDIHVLVRGKAGAEVEFGNKLYLAEQPDGVIVDWKLFEEDTPADTRLVAQSVARLQAHYGAPSGYTTDRGFHSAANASFLAKNNIRDGLCPKSPEALARRMKDDRFVCLQKRRAGTEARIGIFKNAFLGSPLRDKGFAHREHAVHWCVLAHNLWVLARKSLADEAQRKKDAA